MGEMNAYTEPLIIEVFDGEVVITGPKGPTGLSLTPEAAAETARRLADAAQLAATHHHASQASSLED